MNTTVHAVFEQKAPVKTVHAIFEQKAPVKTVHAVFEQKAPVKTVHATFASAPCMQHHQRKACHTNLQLVIVESVCAPCTNVPIPHKMETPKRFSTEN